MMGKLHVRMTSLRVKVFLTVVGQIQDDTYACALSSLHAYLQTDVHSVRRTHIHRDIWQSLGLLNQK
jgi:hypothetical protein